MKMEIIIPFAEAEKQTLIWAFEEDRIDFGRSPNAPPGVRWLLRGLN